MAYMCVSCGKKNWAGRRSQHHKGVAGGSWKHKAQKSIKLFRANLRSYKVLSDGATRRVKLCTDCISIIRKRGKVSSYLLPVMRPAPVVTA